jgi:acyl transferase domain-containing protein
VVLEHGIIPPQALFQSINPEIDEGFYHIKIPTSNVPWPEPDAVRRVSVNSFGFGGCNSHAILDDALHYLQERGLQANHSTVAHPKVKEEEALPLGITNGHHTNGVNGETHDDDAITNGHSNGNGHANGHSNGHSNGHTNGNSLNGGGQSHSIPPPKLLVFSASDEKALKRMTQSYESYYASSNISHDAGKLDDMAYTLAARRSHLLYRTFAVVDGTAAGEGFATAKAVKSTSSEAAGIALVFTGQGAQYVHMGADLLRYPVFEETLKQIDQVYKSLGSTWSVFGTCSRIPLPSNYYPSPI